MAKEQEIKYDGSDAEMMRLGLINEMGEVNNKRRNEFKQYMARVWEKNHPGEKSPYADKYPSKEETQQYFQNQEVKKKDETKRVGILKRIFGRDK